MRAAWLALGLSMAATIAPAHAAEHFVLFNLTTKTTFTGVYLAPAGSTAWGPNETLNDKDKTVEPSERLILKGVAHTRYDVRLVDQAGHECIKRGVDLTTQTSFDIRDADLQACH